MTEVLKIENIGHPVNIMFEYKFAVILHTSIVYVIATNILRV